MDDRLINEREAFDAMVGFLTAYWERGKSEEIAGLLGALALKPVGQGCADPALWNDWLKSIENVVAQRDSSGK